MPFSRPTLSDLVDRIVADVSTRVLGIEGSILRRSILGVLARAEAGAIHMLYGYLDWIAKNTIIDTAESEALERWAAIWGVDRLAATASTGAVTFTGTNNSFVPAGTLIQSQDGVQFTTDADATITAGTAVADVTAVIAGTAGNIEAGASLFLVSPISGVQTAAIVGVDGIAGGTDTESDDGLRARLLDRIQRPPQGGSATDYVQWAREVAGVTRAWVYPLENGAGTVVVRFVTDDDPGGIIPGAGKIAEVAAYIAERRPVTADVYVLAPVAVPLAITIKISPNTTAVQTAVAAELADQISRDAIPGGTVLISRLREAASVATGEANNEFVTPTADVVSATGDITTLGAITFQSF